MKRRPTVKGALFVLWFFFGCATAPKCPPCPRPQLHSLPGAPSPCYDLCHVPCAVDAGVERIIQADPSLFVDPSRCQPLGNNLQFCPTGVTPQ